MTQGMWIIIIGALVACSCASVGVFLVLRRLSMLGDAVSHSVLFGIAGTFLLFGSRAPLLMLAGATAVGVLTVYSAASLQRIARLHGDASIGIVFTFLFALGVILISVLAGQIDLDQECVLYGEIAFAPLDTVQFLGRNFGPRSFWLLLLVALAVSIFIAVGFRQLKTLSFDPLLAASLGVSVKHWHYALMIMVSLVAVASFEAVGAVLVVALLVVPAASALLISTSLLGMLIYANIIGLCSVIAGYYLAAYADASISASIVLCTGAALMLVIAWCKGCGAVQRRRSMT